MNVKRRTPVRTNPLPTARTRKSAKPLAGESRFSMGLCENALHIRPADAGDDAFVLSLVTRFVDFALPKWRSRPECAGGIRRDLKRALANPPPNEALFIAEDDFGKAVGFLRLQETRDFFSGNANCHISDLVVAHGHDGKGIGRALLDHAQVYAKHHRCALITLAVFDGNSRARALYERAGFGPELLRMAKRVK